MRRDFRLYLDDILEAIHQMLYYYQLLFPMIGGIRVTL